jgi:hypothetical protein
VTSDEAVEGAGTDAAWAWAIFSFRNAQTLTAGTGAGCSGAGVASSSSAGLTDSAGSQSAIELVVAVLGARWSADGPVFSVVTEAAVW